MVLGFMFLQATSTPVASAASGDVGGLEQLGVGGGDRTHPCRVRGEGVSKRSAIGTEHIRELAEKSRESGSRDRALRSPATQTNWKTPLLAGRVDAQGNRPAWMRSFRAVLAACCDAIADLAVGMDPRSEDSLVSAAALSPQSPQILIQ